MFHERRAGGRGAPDSNAAQWQADDADDADDAGGESGHDIDSNQAYGSDDGEMSIRKDENLD